MNAFVEEFASKLDAISSRTDLKKLYYWIWDNKQLVAQAAGEINSTLQLSGPFELKPDLPCVTVGSTSGLVVVAANPGWKADLNAKEDAYCQSSREAYTDMMFEFFHRHPIVRDGVYSRWWSRAMRFIAILPEHPEADNYATPVPDRWKTTHRSGLIGGWDLFPWHSSKDGLTSKIRKHHWLRDFCQASVRAVLRLKPKVLFVASSAGYQLIRHDLLLDIAWNDFDLDTVKCAYAKVGAHSEIVAIKLQILANAFRRFTDEQLVAKVRELRRVT